jgi:hypothetical protein
LPGARQVSGKLKMEKYLIMVSSYRKTGLFGTVFNFLLHFEPWFDQLLFETFKAVEVCNSQTKPNLEW